MSYVRYTGGIDKGTQKRYRSGVVRFTKPKTMAQAKWYMPYDLQHAELTMISGVEARDPHYLSGSEFTNLGNLPSHGPPKGTLCRPPLKNRVRVVMASRPPGSGIAQWARDYAGEAAVIDNFERRFGIGALLAMAKFAEEKTSCKRLVVTTTLRARDRVQRFSHEELNLWAACVSGVLNAYEQPYVYHNK